MLRTVLFVSSHYIEFEMAGNALLPGHRSSKGPISTMPYEEVRAFRLSPPLEGEGTLKRLWQKVLALPRGVNSCIFKIAITNDTLRTYLFPGFDVRFPVWQSRCQCLCSVRDCGGKVLYSDLMRQIFSSFFLSRSWPSGPLGRRWRGTATRGFGAEPRSFSAYPGHS